MARSTRCRLSRTAASGSPTRMVLGMAVGETSTSTSTLTASMPNSEKVCSLANMLSPHVGPRFSKASHAHCAVFSRTACKPLLSALPYGDIRLSPILRSAGIRRWAKKFNKVSRILEGFVAQSVIHKIGTLSVVVAGSRIPPSRATA